MLSTESVSYSGLDSLEHEWVTLLTDDAPSALSASPCWIKTWWEVFEAATTEPQWRGIAIRNEAGSLVGLALFYAHKVRFKGIWLRRLELVGQLWRSGLGPRSEYGGFISRPGDAEAVAEAVIAHVASWNDWDEMIIGNAIQDCPGAAKRRELAVRNGWYGRVQESGVTYAMKIEDDFSAYLNNLPGKFRQRAFNHRQKLAKQGQLVSRSADVSESEAFLGILNDFHRKRWGKPVFEGRRMEFHRRLTRELASRNQLCLNVMEVDGRPVSLLYDIIAGTTKYGFQLGFDPDFATKVSLFLVHFGFSIEDAFERKTKRFDMLRGHGRSGAGYKDRIAKPYLRTATEQYLRSPGLRFAARAYDGLRGFRRAKK